MKICITGRIFGKICKICQRCLSPKLWSAIKRRMGRDMNKLLMSVPDTDQQCPDRNIYIFLKFEFYLKPILKNYDIYLLKLMQVTNVSYSPQSKKPSFTILSTSSIFEENEHSPIFWRINRTPIPIFGTTNKASNNKNI